MSGWRRCLGIGLALIVISSLVFLSCFAMIKSEGLFSQQIQMVSDRDHFSGDRGKLTR